MKIHHPISAGTRSRVNAWQRRNLIHFREWDEWRDALERRLQKVLARHLARGGTVVEVFGRGETEWRVGTNCFIRPLKNCPCYIASHVARRVVGFGWKLQLT
jgi:hypothetical protein